jgi:transcriptional regulator with XRE-family HTH domain
MATRQRPADVGAAQARAIIGELSREIRQARLDRGLSQRAVGQEIGLGRSWVSRIERGLVEDLTIRHASMLLAASGMRLSARAFPDGVPIREAGHALLLERFRQLLHRSLRWATEVAMPIRGDLRAWDGVVLGPDWRVGVEAETRPLDLQALKRRLVLKARDGGVDALVLVLLDSRHNRQLLRIDADGLAESFPVPGARALELLAAGVPLGGNAIVLL